MSDPVPTKQPTLNEISKEAYDVARVFGTIQSEEPGNEMPAFFAKLHAVVSHAYETYESGVSVSEVTYFDDNGETSTYEAAGIPSGLPADLAEVFLLLLAGCHLCKVDVDKVVSAVLASQTNFEEDEEEDEEEPTQ
jgi:hypothetical protein